MPIVPRLTDERVRTSALPSVKRGVSTTEETFGGGASTEKTFKSISELSDTAQKIVLESKRQADILAITDAASQLSAEENRILYDPQNGAMLRRGKDAFGLPEQVLKDYDQRVGDIDKNLKNDTQRLFFRRQAAINRISIDDQIQRHVASQIKQYDDNSTKSYLAEERAAATLSGGDPDRVALSLDRQTAILIDYGKRNGFSNEQIIQSIRDARSQTHRETLERMITSNNPRAQAYAEAVKDELTTDDLAIVERARKEAAQVARIQRDTLERDIAIKVVERAATINDLKAFLKSGQIDHAFYTTMENRIKHYNDDDTIPPEQKATMFFEVSTAFARLHGARVETKSRSSRGLPTTPAKGNRLDELKAFRALVVKNAPGLTSEEEQAFLRFTERNLTTAQAGKAGILQTALLAVSASPAMVALAAGRQLLALMKPSVTTEQAATKAQAIVTEVQAASNPNRTRYQIGQMLTNANGLQAEVLGFDERGNPILKWKR